MFRMQLAPHDKPAPLLNTRAVQVWYLSPADADCIGVLRYRVVPHPVLAPTVSSPCPYQPPHVQTGKMTSLTIWFGAFCVFAVVNTRHANCRHLRRKTVSRSIQD